MSIEQVFLSSAIKRFREQKELGDKTLEQLSEAELHRKPNEECNSIAVIIQHLEGNMVSRWTNFLTTDGEKEGRNRDAEFEDAGLGPEQLLLLWSSGWHVLFRALESLKPEDLLKTITIRHQPLVVTDAINRQLAHYCHHVGQIVYLGKWLKGAQWKTISIPKGGSQNFNREMKESGRH